MNGIEIYLVIHGITTVGALVGFLLRNEHRMTKTETRLDALKEQHDKYTRGAGAFLEAHAPEDRREDY